MPAPQRVLLSPADQAALASAVIQLERASLAVRLADYAGQPLNRMLKALPPVANDKIRAAVHAAMLRCLNLAVKSLEKKPVARPSRLRPKLVSGLAGGVSGFVGLAALPIELPVTTTNMLRAIAEVARAEGEDLGDRHTQIACLEVFALGRRGSSVGAEAGYYALRTLLAKATGDAVSYLVQRGVAEESAPVLMRFVSEVATRYGIIVSERAAASALPLIGAIGGATINWIFMDYFQQIARGHFAIRRLERAYGAEPIQATYQEVVRRLEAKRKKIV
ncbi:MAG: EcsC family protein [Beijerinckiaceae bacterium]